MDSASNIPKIIIFFKMSDVIIVDGYNWKSNQINIGCMKCKDMGLIWGKHKSKKSEKSL